MARKKLETKISIRSMVEEDLQGVLAIDRATSGGKRVLTYADPVENYTGGDVNMSWVAEVGDTIVGFVLSRLAEPAPGMPKVAWIELVGVDPDQQHRGIGGRLVEALSEQCKKLGVSRVHVMADRNDEVMKSFFSSLGFKQGNLINYYRRVEE